MPDPEGWKLFDACFKEDEEVVVIDSDDKFHWGRLKNINDAGLSLRKGGWARGMLGGDKTLKWDDIRFMAHDGFPVCKLMGADGSLTIEKLDTKKMRASIRNTLKAEFTNDGYPLKPSNRTYRFGDPFDVENVSSKLYHPGNSGNEYWDKFYNRLCQQYYSPKIRREGFDTEEVIVMESSDGALAELWDLTTVYMFE